MISCQIKISKSIRSATMIYSTRIITFSLYYSHKTLLYPLARGAHKRRFKRKFRTLTVAAQRWNYTRLPYTLKFNLLNFLHPRTKQLLLQDSLFGYIYINLYKAHPPMRARPLPAYTDHKQYHESYLAWRLDSSLSTCRISSQRCSYNLLYHSLLAF